MTLKGHNPLWLLLVQYCGEMVSHRGPAMLPWNRALATSYMLSVVTMFPSAAVWSQFLMESFKL